MFRFTVCIVVMVACLSAWVSAYGSALPSSGYDSSYSGGQGSQAGHAAQAVPLPANVEAQAAALTNAAGAKATAAKINALKWDLLDLYGYETGYPQLVKKYGPLTSLFAAALPPRSFVGKIDGAFVRDYYGKIKHIGESTIGVVAI